MSEADTETIEKTADSSQNFGEQWLNKKKPGEYMEAGDSDTPPEVAQAVGKPPENAPLGVRPPAPVEKPVVPQNNGGLFSGIFRKLSQAFGGS